MSAFRLAAFGFPVETIPARSEADAVAEYRRRHPSAAALRIVVL